MRKRMKKGMKKAGIAAIAVMVAGGLVACGNESDDVADRVNEANQLAQNEEEEDELFSFRKEEKGAVLTQYNGSDEEVEIPREYDGLAVVQIENGAFADNGSEIKKITIPDSVTAIDNNAFPEKWTFTVAAYEGTFAEFYAYNWEHEFESLGEWTAQASSVTIWNKEGLNCVTLSPGQVSDEDWLEGVSFVQEDGKSVLLLDNCDIGMIEQAWTGDLTIELAEGSKNYISGEKGMEGISVFGNLTITGDGDISISGSDYYSLREGEGAGIGYGVCVVGSLTIEDGVQMFAKGGKSKSGIREGVFVWGVLTVSGCKLEAQAGESELVSPAIRVDILFGEDDSTNDGKIVLEGVKIAEGGTVAPVHYVGYQEDSGEAYDIQSGESFADAESVVWSEDAGFEGASSYVRIEPDAAAQIATP